MSAQSNVSPLRKCALEAWQGDIPLGKKARRKDVSELDLDLVHSFFLSLSSVLRVLNSFVVQLREKHERKKDDISFLVHQPEVAIDVIVVPRAEVSAGNPSSLPVVITN